MVPDDGKWETFFKARKPRHEKGIKNSAADLGRISRRELEILTRL